MDLKALHAKLKTLKTPDYRLKQAMRSYYQDLLPGWARISTWPKDLREACSDLIWSPLELIHEQTTQEPASAKLLFQTQDKLRIEAVIMRHRDGRNTVCISSQAGCAMGCAFCATGAQGLGRNLTAEEIVDQVIQAARWLKSRDTRHVTRDASDLDQPRPTSHDSRVTNIVFMGMGEPFNNPDEVFEALKRLMDPDMFGLGARHISISTCGIIPGIQRLAKEAPQVNLAISLHAPTQEQRVKLMPVAKAYALDRLMDAIRDYLRKTNRKVMFEYVMLKGVNDRPDDAEKLANLLSDFRHLAHVNLIKYHPPSPKATADSVGLRQTGKYQASSQEARRSFANLLKRRGLAVTERISFGEEIEAACGQLAGRSGSVITSESDERGDLPFDKLTVVS